MSNTSTFLTKQSHGYTIAKIATLFQGALTTILSILLLLSLLDYEWTTTPIKVFLTLDVLFVISHLTYRTLYKGPKTALSRQTKYILITHSLFSLIALCMTGYYLFAVDDISNYFIVFTILTWFISLIFGDMFFRRKYAQRLSAEK